jgi:hypothetical protein
VRFAQYDEMVETFPSDRPDQSFRKTVLPRRASLDQIEPLCKKLGRRATLRGKTFIHSPFDFDLTLFHNLQVSCELPSCSSPEMGSVWEATRSVGAVFEPDLTRPNAEFRAYHQSGK